MFISIIKAKSYSKMNGNVNAWLTSLILQQRSTYGIHAWTFEYVFMTSKQENIRQTLI